jgi:hypothetical protein
MHSVQFDRSRKNGDMDLEFVFRDKQRQGLLEPLCHAMIGEFPPVRRTACCIFDDEERPAFLNRWGDSYYGFHCAIREYGTRVIDWPSELVSDFTSTDSFGNPRIPDSVLYVRKRTAENSVSASITFAHIMQHVLNFELNRKFVLACSQLRELGLPRSNSWPWELPDEYDAELTSKRVASAVLGAQRVTGHALAQLHANRDIEKWEFFLSLDPAEPFDFPERTKAIVALFRPQLEEWQSKLERRADEPDFVQAEWWK